jgi:hypothetical protein
MPNELQELQLRVSLINEASEGVSRIRDDIKELATGAGKTAMDKLKEEQSELAKQIKELGELAEGGGRALTGYIGKFGVAGAAMGGFAASILVGLGSLKEFADRVVDLTNKAKVIGMNPAELKSLIEQYDRLGVSAGTVEQSMAGLSNVLAQVNRIGSEKRMEMIKAAGQFGTLMEQGIQRIEAQTTQAGKLQEIIRQSYVVYEERMKETDGNRADAIKSQNDFLKLWELDPVLKVLRHVEEVSEEEKKRFEARAKATSEYKKTVSDLSHEVEELGADLSTALLGSGGVIVTGLHLMLDLVKELRELWKQPWVPTNVKSGALTTVDLLKHAATGIGDQGGGATFEERWPSAPTAPAKPASEQSAGLMSAPAPGSTVGDQIPSIGKGWEWMRRSENIEDRREVDNSMRQGDDYLKNIEKNTAETKRLNENFKLLDRGDVELKGLGGLPGFSGGGGGGGFGGGGAGGDWGPNGSRVGPGSGDGAGDSHPRSGKGGGVDDKGAPSEPDTGDTGERVKGTAAGGVARGYERRKGERGEFNYAETGAFGRPGTNQTWITLKNGKKVQVNAAGAEKFKALFNDLLDRGYKINDISGLNVRQKRGGGGLSEHSWGTAVDVNPGRNEFRGNTTDMPADIEEMAWARGISWGGRFGDPMHFEVMSPEAAAHKKKILEARGLLDKTDKEVRTTKVEVNGKLTADVKAPRGSDVKVEGDGAFKSTETNRTMPIESD